MATVAFQVQAEINPSLVRGGGLDDTGGLGADLLLVSGEETENTGLRTLLLLGFFAGEHAIGFRFLPRGDAQLMPALEEMKPKSHF